MFLLLDDLIRCCGSSYRLYVISPRSSTGATSIGSAVMTPAVMAVALRSCAESMAWLPEEVSVSSWSTPGSSVPIPPGSGVSSMCHVRWTRCYVEVLLFDVTASPDMLATCGVSVC